MSFFNEYINVNALREPMSPVLNPVDDSVIEDAFIIAATSHVLMYGVATRMEGGAVISVTVLQLFRDDPHSHAMDFQPREAEYLARIFDTHEEGR